MAEQMYVNGDDFMQQIHNLPGTGTPLFIGQAIGQGIVEGILTACKEHGIDLTAGAADPVADLLLGNVFGRNGAHRLHLMQKTLDPSEAVPAAANYVMLEVARAVEVLNYHPAICPECKRLGKDTELKAHYHWRNHSAHPVIRWGCIQHGDVDADEDLRRRGFAHFTEGGK